MTTIALFVAAVFCICWLAEIDGHRRTRLRCAEQRDEIAQLRQQVPPRGAAGRFVRRSDR